MQPAVYFFKVTIFLSRDFEFLDCPVNGKSAPQFRTFVQASRESELQPLGRTHYRNRQTRFPSGRPSLEGEKARTAAAAHIHAAPGLNGRSFASEKEEGASKEPAAAAPFPVATSCRFRFSLMAGIGGKEGALSLQYIACSSLIRKGFGYSGRETGEREKEAEDYGDDIFWPAAACKREELLARATGT